MRDLAFCGIISIYEQCYILFSNNWDTGYCGDDYAYLIWRMWEAGLPEFFFSVAKKQEKAGEFEKNRRAFGKEKENYK